MEYRGVPLKWVKNNNDSCAGCFFYEENISCIHKEIPACKNGIFVKDRGTKIMMTRLDIEIYKEDEQYCAYIGEAGSSGYECVGSTPEECAEQVKQYIINSFIVEENGNTDN